MLPEIFSALEFRRQISAWEFSNYSVRDVAILGYVTFKFYKSLYTAKLLFFRSNSTATLK